MLDIDITKLPKIDKSIPRCKVVDLGSGAAPKFVTVELPTPDGGRVLAYYTGFPASLAVDDYVRILRTDSDMHYEVVATSGGTAVVDSGGIGANFIINPLDGVLTWQRGTSFTAATTPANSDDTYLADRWILLSDGNDIVDVDLQTSSPPDFASGYLSAIVQTANKKFGFFQPIEGLLAKTLRGETVSLSFQAATSPTNPLSNVRAGILQWTGTEDSVTSDVVSVWNASGSDPTLSSWTFANTPANLALTDSWQTFSVEAITLGSTINNLGVFIWVDDTDGAANDALYLATVKLEIGAAATDFVPRQPAQELGLAQRYFEVITPGASSVSLANGQCFSSSGAGGPIFYRRKRTVPTITYSSAGHFDATNSGGGLTGGASSITINNTGLRASNFQLGGLTGLAAGDGTNIYMINSSAYVRVDAEL